MIKEETTLMSHNKHRAIDCFHDVTCSDITKHSYHLILWHTKYTNSGTRWILVLVIKYHICCFFLWHHLCKLFLFNIHFFINYWKARCFNIFKCGVPLLVVYTNRFLNSSRVSADDAFNECDTWPKADFVNDRRYLSAPWKHYIYMIYTLVFGQLQSANTGTACLMYPYLFGFRAIYDCTDVHYSYV